MCGCLDVFAHDFINFTVLDVVSNVGNAPICLNVDEAFRFLAAPRYPASHFVVVMMLSHNAKHEAVTEGVKVCVL